MEKNIPDNKNGKPLEYYRGQFGAMVAETMAERSGFARSYFISLFKKRCGEAPYARITRLRLAKAKVLLRSTQYPVAKIASLCGFSSPNAFANVFRKDTGKTPGEFRRL